MCIRDSGLQYLLLYLRRLGYHAELFVREDVYKRQVHEMAKDEARHGKGFEGLYKRYFGK